MKLDPEKVFESVVDPQDCVNGRVWKLGFVLITIVEGRPKPLVLVRMALLPVFASDLVLKFLSFISKSFDKIILVPRQMLLEGVDLAAVVHLVVDERRLIPTVNLIVLKMVEVQMSALAFLFFFNKLLTLPHE